MQSDQEGVLFVGATDDGKIEEKPFDLDSIQKKLSEKLQDVFPPVYYSTRTVQESGRECLAIIVPGSVSKPHFAGPAYLRDGSKSVKASTQQFESLIASRISKVYELQKWVGKQITLRRFAKPREDERNVPNFADDAAVVDVNQFYVTLNLRNRNWSFPLSRLEICFDNDEDRLEIELLPPRI